jgi:hypothetical protein
MADQITRLRVFISSPSNLDAERGVITKVFEILSSELSEDKGIEFSVFDWKRDAVPGIGPDVQSVVSSQLRYDIYIGLLGSIFGTPTSRAGSGTEEEFNDAYAKFQQAPNTVRVLFYFKTATDNIFQVNPDQLASVFAFRSKLGPRGVLYHDFADVDTLRDDVRSHIRALLRTDWENGAWKDIVSPIAVEGSEITDLQLSKLADQAKENDISSEEAPGYLELVISSTTAGKELKEHLERMTLISSDFGQAMTLWSEKLSSSPTNSPEQAKAAFDEFAGFLRSYQRKIQPELSIYQAATNQTITSLRGISNLIFDEHVISLEEIRGINNSFEQLIDAMKTTRSHLQQFRELLDKSPSFTMAFRSAKKHLSASIDEFVSSYTMFLGSAETLAVEIRERLSDGKNS